MDHLVAGEDLKTGDVFHIREDRMAYRARDNPIDQLDGIALRDIARGERVAYDRFNGELGCQPKGLPEKQPLVAGEQLWPGDLVYIRRDGKAYRSPDPIRA